MDRKGVSALIYVPVILVSIIFVVGAGIFAACPDWMPGCGSTTQIQEKVVFSSSSSSAFQVGQVILYTDYQGREGHERIREFLYCYRQQNGCKNPPDRSSIRQMLQSRMDAFFSQQGLGDRDYHVELYNTTDKVLEIGSTFQGDATHLAFPITLPTGETGSIEFTMALGDMQAVVEG